MTSDSDTIASAKKIAQSIASLPPLPVTAQEILTCFGDEFIDAKKVSSVVEGDPGICARLLGLTNSAYFGLAEPVTNVHEAILRVLGVDTVRSLVLAMAIQRSFNSRNCPAFDTERFWLSSLQTAECCKRIIAADETSSAAARDLAYSTGLCHNLGLMALAHIAPAETHAVLEKHAASGETASLSKSFLKKFETNHKIVTLALADSWSLPDPMIAAYQYQAFPEQSVEDDLGRIVSAAVAVVGNTRAENGKQKDIGSYARALGIAGEDLEKMAALGERQLGKVRSLVRNLAG